MPKRPDRTVGTLVFHRTPDMTATAALGFWHNPFASVADNKLTTIVGGSTSLAATPLRLPIPFLAQITQVDGGNAPLAPAAIVNTGKPTAAIGQLHDIRSTVTRSSSVAGTQFADSGASNRVTTPISATQVAGNTKNWTETAATGYSSAVGIQQWYVHDAVNASSSIELRARTNTSVTNAPFTRVHIFRRNANTPAEWDYLGDATAAQTLDQGGARFFRWTFTGGSSAQGQYTIAALASQDVIIAVGADNGGAGLATGTTTLGVAPDPAVFTTQTVVSSTAFAEAPAALNEYYNADPAFTTTLTPSANPNSANLSFACSSSNTSYLTATMGAGGVCTITPVGTVVAAAGINVTLTFSITGSATGFSSTTITKTYTVTRKPAAAVPGVTAVSLAANAAYLASGSAAQTIPVSTRTMVPTPTQPVGAPAVTYSYTSSNPAIATVDAATGVVSAVAGQQGQVTITVTATTPAAAGFSAVTGTTVQGTTTVTVGRIDDYYAAAGAGFRVATASATVNSGATLNLTLENGAATSITPVACVSSAPTTAASPVTAGLALAAAANEALTSAASPTNTATSITAVTYTCTGTRADQQVGGVYYAAITAGSSRAATASVIPFAIIPGSLSVSPASPVFKTSAQTVQVTPTVTQATGAAAATFAYAVAAGDCTLSAAAGASTLVQAGTAGTQCSITVTATAVTNGSAVGNSVDNVASPVVVNINP